MDDDNCVVQLVPAGNIVSDRLLKLTRKFTEEYDGQQPSFIARAPGRVNLIGEHIDYCGYAVLPMALEQEMLIAFNNADDASNLLRICNVADEYPKYSCQAGDVTIDKTNKNPYWYNYVLCGYLGIVEHFELERPKGMSLCVSGNIPASAGLSSSSALVCASALATLHANGCSMSKNDLAALCARSERYVGTEGGGMDQAIAFLAEAGSAKLIEFNPLKATEVQLPEGAEFVIANSCADINKAATSDFNTRVVECRLAAQVLAEANGLNWKSYRKLEEVRKALGLPLSEMAEAVEKTLHHAPYTKTEVCEILGTTPTELNAVSLSANTQHVETFRLFQRATHVFTEANRVWEFKRVCEEDSPLDSALSRLGSLMNESHASCRDLYECSHPNLDELVEISMNAGALGSRLTGAGWGGCTVSLVPSNKVRSFLEQVKKDFYEKSSARISNVQNSIFPTQPGGGAVIYKL